ncbi:MAG: DNA polymerase III subunit delta' [Wolbachia endosymbiont of Menacanthus eurysternus]|nr:MAG: DNA polymerase III subunit delta' [Wolbachia endosymbiont of Menacanthus eurysternus]
MENIIGHDYAKKKLIENLSIQTWLICGKRGIGKATFVRSFSDWLLVKRGNEVVMDLYFVDNGTIGIEKVREIKNFLYLSSIQSKYKIVIIDSLEAMTNNSQNAMLKILEEPPKNSKIFIISHEPYNIKSTIKCRCFQLNLFPLGYVETRRVILSKYKFDDQVLSKIITVFPGRPGVIINIMNNNDVCEFFHTFPQNLNKPEIISRIISSEIELEFASRLIQLFILNKIKSEISSVEILLDKWKKIHELFIAAKQLDLDKKHILANAINIITSV